jgi:formylglycine-generating enzyme required for sulfatase activity
MTHPVGQKLPNPWGLYDMHGSVWEWCQDRYSYNLPGGIALDPQGPTEGSRSVFRGGAGDCRSALRLGDYSADRFSFVGFRVVLAPGHP